MNMWRRGGAYSYWGSMCAKLWKYSIAYDLEFVNRFSKNNFENFK